MGGRGKVSSLVLGLHLGGDLGAELHEFIDLLGISGELIFLRYIVKLAACQEGWDETG